MEIQAFNRGAEVFRKTKETEIRIKLALDGDGSASISTGVGFFDHMLDGFSRHGLFNLEAEAKGDLQVDCHHTIEDCGIVLGNAIRAAVGEKEGMTRFGSFILPMDEVLVLCAIDLGGRPYFRFDYDYSVPMIGSMDTEMVREFFYAVSYSAMMNLHLKVLEDGNAHHVTEGLFKAFGRALDSATKTDPRIKGAITTKGTL